MGFLDGAVDRMRATWVHAAGLWVMVIWSAFMGATVLGVTLGVVRAAAQEKRTIKPNPMTRAEVQRGRAEFQRSCAMCHGPEAKGASGPNLMESSLVRHDERGELIGRVIREGKLARGMPAFPNLGAPQVNELAAFLHAMVDVSDNRGSAGPALGYSLKQIMTGDPVLGQAYFNGVGTCSQCHSATGDLKGVARKYTPQELERQLLYPSDRPEQVSVTLATGKRVEGQLLHLDGFYVALRDSKGNYRSWPLRPDVKVNTEDPLRRHRDLLESYKDKDIHDVFAYLETLR